VTNLKETFEKRSLLGYIGTAFSIRAALVAVSAILSPVLLLYAYVARKTGGRVQ
jgi:hypothetical protein